MFVFRKFGVLCFLETPVLRFDLLPYYRRNKRISDNVEKLTTVFDHHNDCVYNTVTKKILPEKFAKIFLNHEQEGAEKRLQKFTNDRIEGNISIWKPLKKTKLPTFNANVKSFKRNIDGKTIRFKEETNFIS